MILVRPGWTLDREGDRASERRDSVSAGADDRLETTVVLHH